MRFFGRVAEYRSILVLSIVGRLDCDTIFAF